MILYTVHGSLRHRLLVSYAADPGVITPLLPDRFRPHLVRDRLAEPVDVDAHTAFYDDHLPTGAARLDHALLLRDVTCTWRSVA